MGSPMCTQHNNSVNKSFILERLPTFGLIDDEFINGAMTFVGSLILIDDGLLINGLILQSTFQTFNIHYHDKDIRSIIKKESSFNSFNLEIERISSDSRFKQKCPYDTVEEISISKLYREIQLRDLEDEDFTDLDEASQKNTNIINDSDESNTNNSRISNNHSKISNYHNQSRISNTNSNSNNNNNNNSYYQNHNHNQNQYQQQNYNQYQNNQNSISLPKSQFIVQDDDEEQQQFISQMKQDVGNLKSKIEGNLSPSYKNLYTQNYQQLLNKQSSDEFRAPWKQQQSFSSQDSNKRTTNPINIKIDLSHLKGKK